MKPPRIVLASTSRYRAALLRRLVDEFEQLAPPGEEATIAGEAPRERATRLAAAKASAVATLLDDALVIGSDQVAALGNTILHKPGDAETALQQLRASSGKIVDFHTAVHLVDSRSGRHSAALDHTRVVFRDLGDEEIRRYLERDQPFDCAGSFKAESAGIALFERIDSGDPTALVGLPLIALSGLLRQAGFAVP